MSARTVLFQRQGTIAEITLNRPDRENSISLSLAQELREVCQQIGQDREIRAVILAAAGEHFSIGTDLEELDRGLKGLSAPGETPGLVERYSVASAVASLMSPTIAAINGDALGQGLELALGCDIRLASEETRLGLPQVALGLLSMDGASQRLPRIIGRGKALEMLLTSCIVDAGEALRLGLVSKVVPRGKVLEEARSLATQLATKAPLALRFAREAVNRGMDLTLEQGLRLEADLYFLLHTTEDRTEGITAFREKRHPRFKGT